MIRIAREKGLIDCQIIAGDHIKCYIAEKFGNSWAISRVGPDSVDCILNGIPLDIVFKFFRKIEKSLLSFEKCGIM